VGDLTLIIRQITRFEGSVWAREAPNIVVLRKLFPAFPEISDKETQNARK